MHRQDWLIILFAMFAMIDDITNDQFIIGHNDI